jgi:hypothetical protein
MSSDGYFFLVISVWLRLTIKIDFRHIQKHNIAWGRGQFLYIGVRETGILLTQ